jgi:pimeloyl-ACP methyl ester carboxylesterase
VLPVTSWPRQLISLPGGERVSLASTAPDSGGLATAAGGAVAPERVLCVHGMAGAATNWTDFMAELAGDFACDAVDLPGSGWSPPPATMAGYSIRALAGTVTKVIEQRGGGPVHLVGNSMGGLIAVRVAATRPDLVRTLTLLSPALPDRLIRRSIASFPLLGLPGIGERMLRRADAFPAEGRVRGLMGMLFYDPGTVRPEQVRAAVAETERRDTLGYASQSLVGAARAITVEYLRPGWAAGHAWRLARAVRCPVLALYGSHDQLVSPRMARRAAREFSDCRVMVLPCTGHVPQLEHPVRVAAEFRELAAAARGMTIAPPEFDPITEPLK